MTRRSSRPPPSSLVVVELFLNGGLWERHPFESREKADDFVARRQAADPALHARIVAA